MITVRRPERAQASRGNQSRGSSAYDSNVKNVLFDHGLGPEVWSLKHRNGRKGQLLRKCNVYDGRLSRIC